MAMTPAILGLARLGNFRLGYVPAALEVARRYKVHIVLGNQDVSTQVRVGSVTIGDALNDAPNTAALTIQGGAPSLGQNLRISVASRLLFNGTIQTIGVRYEGRPQQWAYPCTAIDDLTRLNRRRPFGTWTNQSATVVAQALIAGFAPGFSAVHVQAGLPTVTVICTGKETFANVLSQIAKDIGGYFYVEDLDLHLFLTETTEAPDPITVGGATPWLDDPPIASVVDLSQVRTRLFGIGANQATLVDLPAGATSIPIADATPFTAAGGTAIVGAVRIAYTGVALGGAVTSSRGDPSVAAPIKPTATHPIPLVSGALKNGTYEYVVAYGVDGGGLTAVGPGDSLAISMGTLSAGATAQTPTTGGALTPSTSYAYAWTLVTANGESDVQSTASAVALSATQNAFTIMSPTWSDPRILHVNAYRNGRLAFSADSHVVHFDGAADASLGPGPPLGGSTAHHGGQIQVAVPVSANPRVTSRILYRRDPGQLLYHQVTTLSDNTTTAWRDNTAAATGAPPLAASTVALQAGSTSLPVASTGGFTSGWAKAGSQVVTFPAPAASGPGSLVSPVPYDTEVTAVAALLGVTGLPATPKGSTVAIWVQRDDLAAQAALAALDPAGDGIYEDALEDARRTEPALVALLTATLARFSRPLATVTYATRDLKTKSGKTVVVTLAQPPISVSLTIQSVTITEIDVAPGLPPRFTVTASNVRFSLDDLLRRLTDALEG